MFVCICKYRSVFFDLLLFAWWFSICCMCVCVCAVWAFDHQTPTTWKLHLKRKLSFSICYVLNFIIFLSCVVFSHSLGNTENIHANENENENVKYVKWMQVALDFGHIEIKQLASSLYLYFLRVGLWTTTARPPPPPKITTFFTHSCCLLLSFSPS